MILLKQLFQSKYKNRIENEINKLHDQLLLIIIEKNKFKQTTNTTEHVKWILKENDIKQDIILLQSLLN